MVRFQQRNPIQPLPLRNGNHRPADNWQNGAADKSAEKRTLRRRHGARSPHSQQQTGHPDFLLGPLGISTTRCWRKSRSQIGSFVQCPNGMQQSNSRHDNFQPNVQQAAIDDGKRNLAIFVAVSISWVRGLRWRSFCLGNICSPHPWGPDLLTNLFCWCTLTGNSGFRKESLRRQEVGAIHENYQLP